MLAREASEHTYFNEFEKQLPTAEARFEVAQQLAIDDPNLAPPKEAYVSHNLFAAQWGDTDQQLIDTILLMRRTKIGVDANVREPIIVVRKGSIDAITSDDDELDENVEIVWGVLPEIELGYGFKGNLSHRGASRMGVEPPYLGFGLMAPIVRRHDISADAVGDTAVTESDRKRTEVPLYVGTVPMTFDVDLYRDKRNTRQYTAVIGRRACRNIVEGLARKTKDEATRQVLERLSLKPPAAA